MVDTGANVQKAAERAFDKCCQEAGVQSGDVGFVVGTGYGRYKIAFGNAQMTEISCHAKGAQFVCPGTRTVIDMGGQDSKAISVGAKGEVLDFVMNDKCAAGTGRFLANAAEVMGIGLDQVGPMSLKATRPVKMATVCTVFVESDILSYLAQGKKAEDILGGVHLAIAKRTMSLARRVSIEPEITVTGGVARNIGMVKRPGGGARPEAAGQPGCPFHRRDRRGVVRAGKAATEFRIQHLERGTCATQRALTCGTGFTKAVILSQETADGLGRPRQGPERCQCG